MIKVLKNMNNYTVKSENTVNHLLGNYWATSQDTEEISFINKIRQRF